MMRKKTILRTFTVILVFGLLAGSLTVLLPLEDGNAVEVHNCLTFNVEVEIIDGEVVITVHVGGRIVGHAHANEHPFTC